jgi:hypothetical protein
MRKRTLFHPMRCGEIINIDGSTTDKNRDRKDQEKESATMQVNQKKEKRRRE